MCLSPNCSFEASQGETKGERKSQVSPVRIRYKTVVSVKGIMNSILVLCLIWAEPLRAASWQPVAQRPCQTNLGTDSLPRCDFSEDETRRALNEAMPRGMNICKQEAQKAIRCCFSPDMKNCQWEDLEPLNPRHGSAGIAASFDMQIEDFVGAYNVTRRRQFLCDYFIRENCRKPCEKYRDEAYAEVPPYQNSSPEELNNSAPPISVEGIAADVVLKSVCEQRLEGMTRCLGSQADLYKQAASSTLTCRKQAASSNSQLNQIVCYTTERGLEQCQYSASDTPSYQDMAALGRPAAVDQTYGQLQVRDSSGKLTGNCSATAFGDGTQAITAAHCFDSNGGRATLWTPDAQGRMQSSAATCSGNDRFDYTAPGSMSHDTVICTLDRPAYVSRPLFVATRDPAVSSGCIPHDHYLRCAPQEFERMSGTQVEVVGFPRSQTRDGQFRPILSNGRLQYDRNTGGFVSDTLTDPGSSGAGYITDMYGYRVILTNTAIRYDASQLGGAPVIEWRDVERMRTRLTAQKVNGAESTFR